MKQSDNESTKAPDGEVPRDEAESASEAGEAAVNVEESTGPEVEGAPNADAEAVAKLVAELQAKAEERDVFLDQLRRKSAELDNFQKRVRRERPAWEEQAVGRFVRELLPVVDNFDRALESIEGPGGGKALEEGVRLIHQMLRQVLNENGIEEIAAEGEAFDPEWHEAMVQEPVEDRPTGEIIDVLEKGYRLRASILRPSKVKVALNVKESGEGRQGDAPAEGTDAAPTEDEKG